MQTRNTINGYYVFSSFVHICHVLERNRERFGFSVFLFLCTLEDGKNPEKSDKYENDLKDAISMSIGDGEAFTQYDKNRYLILTMGDDEERERMCRAVQSNLSDLSHGQANVTFEMEVLG